MRILCLIPALGPGGAERVMGQLVSHLAARHDVSIMTFEAPGTESFYPLPRSARIVQADLLGGTGSVHRILRILGRIVVIRREVLRSRPDVVVSFLDTMNLLTIAGCLKTGVPAVVSERVDPTARTIGPLKRTLRRWVYPYATCCVVQTERIKSYFGRFPRVHVTVIPNPVSEPAQNAEPAIPNSEGRFRVIAMGRLEPQKGFDLLVEAFARASATHPRWDLVIFGEGSARGELEAQIKRYGLDLRVCLPGVTTEPARELAASHIMAFPSRFEGFPNALAEGMAAGLPPIGHRDVSGVEELIRDGEAGLLIPLESDPSRLTDALCCLMDDPALRVRLGARARMHVEKWRPEIVLGQWDACLAAAAKCRTSISQPSASDDSAGGNRPRGDNAHGV